MKTKFKTKVKSGYEIFFAVGEMGGVMTRERQIKGRRERLLRQRRSGVEGRDGCGK